MDAAPRPTTDPGLLPGLHPGLLGRDDVLARIEELLAGCRDGRGAVLWLRGEAGIGKSTVLAELARRAAGLQVLRAAAWEDPGTPAFWLWTQVLRGAAEVVPPEEWGERGERARALLAPQTGSSGEDPGRFPLFDGVGAVLELLSRRGPVVLVLDDLHWADAGSLQLLRFLTADPGARPVLVACGWRDHEESRPGEELALVDELTARADVWPLRGLGQSEVADLIAATTGRVPEREEAREITARTGGNPLFVSETARLSRARGEDALQVVPDSAQATTRRRVARLAQPVADALSHASVLGTSLSWSGLTALLGVRRSELAKLLDPLLEAGLLTQTDDGLAFRHALIRDAVYDAVPVARRRELHLRVARALQESGAGDAERAHHLGHALPLVEIEEVLTATLGAARAARAVQAHEEAVRWCDRALELTAPHTADRAEVALLAGEARLAVGDVEQARALFAEAAAVGRDTDDADLVARAALGFAAGLSGFEVRLWDRAQTELLEDAAARLGGGDSVRLAQVLARLSVALSFSASTGRRRELAESAVAMARRLEDPATLGAALAAHCDAISGPAYSEQREAEATEIIGLAQRVHEAGLELLGLRLRVVARWERGDMAGGGQDVTAFEQLSSRLRQPLYSWYVALWRGARAHLSGDLATMSACADEAARVGALGGSRNAAVLAVVQRAWPLYEVGRSAEASAILYEELGDLPELAGDGGSWGRLFPGTPRAAHEVAVSRIAEMLPMLPEDSEWISALAAAAEGLWEHDVGGEPATLLYESLLPFAHRFLVDGIGAALGGSLEVVLGELATLLGDHTAAEQHLTRAIAADAAIGGVLARAKAERRLAELLRRRGAPGDADRRVELLTSALAAYRSAGIAECVADLEAELGQTTAPAPDRSRGPAAAPSGAFLRSGGHWTVSWHGEQAVLPAVKGMADLAVLLAQPGREVHVLDLVGTPPELRSDLGAVLDETARAAYRARLTELDERLAEAGRTGDAGAAESAEQERDFLLAELGSAYGLGGRVRRAGDPAERARTTVTSRVRDAIARLDAQLPALGRHLRASVRTGVYCCYEPEVPTVWETAPTS